MPPYLPAEPLRARPKTAFGSVFKTSRETQQNFMALPSSAQVRSFGAELWSKLIVDNYYAVAEKRLFYEIKLVIIADNLN